MPPRAIPWRMPLVANVLFAAAVACGAGDDTRGGATPPDEGGAPFDASLADGATIGSDAGGIEDGDARAPANDASGQVTCPPTSVLMPGEVTRTLTSGGVARTYIVHVPPNYTGHSAVPLVFDFHPLQVAATTWKIATGWPSVADSKGFILVWPQGVGDSWNAGRCCGQAQQQGVDDVAFLRAMTSELARDSCI